MSKYEDYNRVSTNYDKQRSAMGVDVVAAMMQFYCGKPLKDLHVLDAGCGTGNYAKALLDFGVGNITLLDASRGMLDKVREKLASEIASGRVKEVVETTMPPLPFPDATFDVVMFNQVLHHLTHQPDGINFPEIEEVLKDARRIIKPEGVLCITSGPNLSYYESVWFVHLNKEIAKRFVKKFPHDRQWHEIFLKSGFQCASYLNLNIDLQGVYQPDPEGPTKKEWRDGNSYWASATDEEIKEIERNIYDMKAKGTLEHFFLQFDKSNTFFVVPFFIAKPT